MTLSEVLEKYHVKRNQPVVINGKVIWVGKAEDLYSDEFIHMLNLIVKKFDLTSEVIKIYI